MKSKSDWRANVKGSILNLVKTTMCIDSCTDEELIITVKKGIADIKQNLVYESMFQPELLLPTGRGGGLKNSCTNTELSLMHDFTVVNKTLKSVMKLDEIYVAQVQTIDMELRKFEAFV